MRSRDQYDSVVRTRNPTGVGTMNLITKPFFPQKPSGREQLVGRFDGLAPGRLLLVPHSHAITVGARGKRYGASTLSCPRKQLHHYCLSRRRHIVHITQLADRSPQEDPFSNTTSMRKARYRLNTPKKRSRVKTGRIIRVDIREGCSKPPLSG